MNKNFKVWLFCTLLVIGSAPAIIFLSTIIFPPAISEEDVEKELRKIDDLSSDPSMISVKRELERNVLIAGHAARQQAEEKQKIFSVLSWLAVCITGCTLIVRRERRRRLSRSDSPGS